MQANYNPTLIVHITGKIKLLSLRPYETTILLHFTFSKTIVLYYHRQTIYKGHPGVGAVKIPSFLFFQLLNK